MKTCRRRDTHLRHQESTLDLLAKRHGQSPQDETVLENGGFNLAERTCGGSLKQTRHSENQISGDEATIPSLAFLGTSFILYLSSIYLFSNMGCPFPQYCSPFSALSTEGTQKMTLCGYCGQDAYEMGTFYSVKIYLSVHLCTAFYC